MNGTPTRTLIMLSAIFLLILFYSHPTWLPSAAIVNGQATPARVYIATPNGSANFTDLGHKNTSITFAVNIGSAPSIGGFVVYISYNATNNKSVLISPSIDYTGNVLVGSTQVVNNCVANVGICSGIDATGPLLERLSSASVLPNLETIRAQQSLMVFSSVSRFRLTVLSRVSDKSMC